MSAKPYLVIVPLPDPGGNLRYAGVEMFDTYTAAQTRAALYVTLGQAAHVIATEGQQPHSDGIVIDTPITSDTAPSYNEIIVDPNGTYGAYTTIADAFTYVATVATAASPWTVRLLPGIYTQTTSLTAPANCSLVGAGMYATTIKGVVNGASVLTISAVSNFRMADLKIQNNPTDYTASSQCVSVTNGTGFRATNVWFDGSMTTLITVNDSTNPTRPILDSTIKAFHNCLMTTTAALGNTASDGFSMSKSAVSLVGCRIHADMGTTESFFDAIFQTAGYLVMAGCDVRVTSGATITSNNGNGGLLVNTVANSTLGTETYVLGSRVSVDWSGGGVSSTGSFLRAVMFNGPTAANATGDQIFYSAGSSFDLRTGTIVGASCVAPMIIMGGKGGQTGGNFYLYGTNLRDLAGSGGSVRKALVIRGVTQGTTTHAPQNIIVEGSDIASWDVVPNVVGTAPTVNMANLIVREQTLNYQTGTATFASGSTIAVTFGKTYSDAAGVTFTTWGKTFADYTVTWEVPTNPATESFWVTNKTATGFVLNSNVSGGASTAVVRWKVTR